MGLFHRFKTDVSRVERPVRFNNPFRYKPHPLAILAADEVRKAVACHDEWMSEAAKGKMFGVLVVRDLCGDIGFLAAYSGLLCGCNNTDYFVPAVYDMLQCDGYFKREEENITQINNRVRAMLEGEEYRALAEALCTCRADADCELYAMRERMQASKRKRDEMRISATLTRHDDEVLIRESQFQKAEYKRLLKSWQERILLCEQNLDALSTKIEALKEERKQRSAALQRWLFEQFGMLNACGNRKTLFDIFEEHNGALPPAGAGECAAPKLLQYAYLNGFHPLCMAEFWMGTSPVGELRRDGCYYGACKGKCEPILYYMLQGLDVDDLGLECSATDFDNIEFVYEDDSIVVVNKPSGILSVPGVIGGCSIQEWLRSRYCNDDIFVVHRLDMATSGLLVAAKNREVFVRMQRMFASREVSKSYIALLNGLPSADSGEILLPLSGDYMNRPRQKVDFEHGKEAVTRYVVLDVIIYKGRSCARVSMSPLTGRTHQLRVHCAHRLGLDCPIVGDELYGTSDERLMLHASCLEFAHPVTGKRLTLECKSDF